MSNAIDLTGIYIALKNHYSGIFINTGSPPSSTAVTVFIEEPSSELVRERVYPSINIKFLSAGPDYTSYESDDDSYEEIAYDDSLPVHERSMREAPLPSVVQFSVDTWHKLRAKEDFDFQLEVMKKTKPRFSIPAINIDGQTIYLWVFTSGNTVQRDEYEPDMVIYHKTITINVLAHLTRVDSDDTIEEKVVMTESWEFTNRKIIEDDNGNITEGEETTDAIIEVTDTDESLVN